MHVCVGDRQGETEKEVQGGVCVEGRGGGGTELFGVNTRELLWLSTLCYLMIVSLILFCCFVIIITLLVGGIVLSTYFAVAVVTMPQELIN